jgi:hypothetical protein
VPGDRDFRGVPVCVQLGVRRWVVHGSPFLPSRLAAAAVARAGLDFAEPSL